MKRQVKEPCAKVGVKIGFQTKMKSKQYCEVLKHGPKTLWHFSLRSAVCIPFPGIWSLPTVDWWSWQWHLGAGHGPYHVGGFHLLYSVVVQGIYSLLILLLAWSMSYWQTDGSWSLQLLQGVCLSILQLYPFLPHVFWHFIVRYIHFENFCVFFRKLTSLSLWNAPLYLWWSLESSEVSA